MKKREHIRMVKNMQMEFVIDKLDGKLYIFAA